MLANRPNQRNYVLFLFWHHGLILLLKYPLYIVCGLVGYSVNDTGDLVFDEFLDDPMTAISRVRRPRSVGAANKKERQNISLKWHSVERIPPPRPLISH